MSERSTMSDWVRRALCRFVEMAESDERLIIVTLDQVHGPPLLHATGAYIRPTAPPMLPTTCLALRVISALASYCAKQRRQQNQVEWPRNAPLPGCAGPSQYGLRPRIDATR